MNTFRALCSKKHILYTLYGTLFLLPLDPYFFYVALIPAIFLWIGNWHFIGDVSLKLPPWWGIPVAFLGCAFASAFVSHDMVFYFFNDHHRER